MNPSTDAIDERSRYIQLEDHATGETLNCWLIYRPADPFFVRVAIDGSAVPLEVPRAVIHQGMVKDAMCLHMWACPAADDGWALWTVQVGGLRRRTFRVSIDLLTKHLTAMYELVPLGEEGAGIDWDAAWQALPKSR